MRQKTRCAAVAGIIAIAVCGTLTFYQEIRGRAGAAAAGHTSAKAGRTSEKQFYSRKDTWQATMLASQEAWRSAPYLNDGRAVGMKEVLTKYNQGDRHGVTSTLSDTEIDELVEFILSLPVT